MTTTIGSYSLAVAALASAGAALFAIAAARRQRDDLLELARRCMMLFLILLTVGCGALLAALLGEQFHIAYVASYTERNLPFGYKIAAFWAGQEGSLLLWAWLLGICCTLAAWRRRAEHGVEAATTLAVLAAVCSFFMLLLVFAADPFAVLPQAPADGRGLNPLLQHPSMVAHPPILFAGYAATTVPLAIMIGALVAGRRDNGWVMAMRPWLLLAWVTLTAGILLGAQWAYVELGWGGYWAWDPVENASLLPWLTATALLHSIGMQRHMGTFKWWNAGLTAATFLLCLLATYLTRSGVLSQQSVHSFAASQLGHMFLAFIILGTAGCVALMVWRRGLLKAESRIEMINSKAMAFLGVNVLLVVMTVIIAAGTLWPVISNAVIGRSVSVGPPFYNQVILPIALVLLAIMVFGPLMKSGRGPAVTLLGALIPAAAAVLGVVGCLAWGITNLWSLAAAAIIGFGVVAVLVGLMKAARKQAKLEGGSTIGAIFSQIDGNHRRYGGQLAHLGVLMLLVGVVGSGVYGQKQAMQMRPGDDARVGEHVFTLKRIQQLPRPEGQNYRAVQADVQWTGADGEQVTLHPQMRFYDKASQAHGEVALHSNLSRDVYVTLAGWEDGGQLVALEVIINPLTSWIWLGGLTLVIAGAFCAFPRLLPQRADAPQTRPAVSLPLAGQHMETTT